MLNFHFYIVKNPLGLDNLVRTCNIKITYVENYEPWLVILAATAFATCSATNMLKRYNLGQMIFFRDVILPIKNKAFWELICQQNQA